MPDDFDPKQFVAEVFGGEPETDPAPRSQGASAETDAERDALGEANSAFGGSDDDQK